MAVLRRKAVVVTRVRKFVKHIKRKGGPLLASSKSNKLVPRWLQFVPIFNRGLFSALARVGKSVSQSKGRRVATSMVAWLSTKSLEISTSHQAVVSNTAMLTSTTHSQTRTLQCQCRISFIDYRSARTIRTSRIRSTEGPKRRLGKVLSASQWSNVY